MSSNEGSSSRGPAGGADASPGPSDLRKRLPDGASPATTGKRGEKNNKGKGVASEIDERGNEFAALVDASPSANERGRRKRSAHELQDDYRAQLREAFELEEALKARRKQVQASKRARGIGFERRVKEED